MALENDVFEIGLSCDFILSKRLHFAFLSREKAPQSYAIPWISYSGEFVLENKSTLIQISRLEGSSEYEHVLTNLNKFSKICSKICINRVFELDQMISGLAYRVNVC